MATKLHPPPVRPGTVARTGLVELLLRSEAVPVVAMVAPPGYGKTTVLVQWARRVRRRVGWVTVDAGDNDPATLLSYVAGAHGPAAPETGRANDARVDPTVAQAAAALGSIPPPFSLVLDQAELLTDGRCRQAVAELALRLPLGSQLVVACREEPPLPLALLRSRGQVLEIGPDELAMDRREARALLEAADVRLAEADTTRLLRRTEGWPVGLYLAAAVVREGSPRATGGAGPVFSGADHLLAEYFRSELLSRLPRDRVSFLTRTAILDRLSAPVCDAVLDATGSGRILDDLKRAHLFLVPLDRRHEWYRYHRQFHDLLRAELRRLEPEVVPELHARAAAWWEANGRLEAAVGHAHAGGDADRVARLVAGLVLAGDAARPDAPVHRWLEWFDDQGSVERYPPIAVLGALVQALAGSPAAVERWAAAADRAPADGALPDGSPTGAWAALLRAVLCRHGVARMRADAEAADEGLAPRSPWRAMALLLQGLGRLLEGDPERADATLAHAVDVAEHAGALFAASVALAEQAIVALGRHDWPAAGALVDRARAAVRAGRLDDQAPNALVRAVAARTAVHRGDDYRAREDLAAASRLRPLLTATVPTLAVQVRLELAAAHLERADVTGARVVLREALDLLQTRADLGTLGGRADELRAQADALHGRTMGAPGLTKAELRLLPFLSTHLSFREIGERLHVSRHTVKTQAMSVYRKLGASSRSEAIERVREIGLLAD